MKNHQTALVIGAGAFGTSIAYVLAQNFKQVIILLRSSDIYQEIKKGLNSQYLPGQTLCSNIVPALSWDEVYELSDEIEVIVSGLPMSGITSFNEKNHQEIKKFLSKAKPFISLAKGIDHHSLKLPDELYLDFYENYQDQIMYLSGPSFAKEIVDHQVTLVSLAGKNKDYLMTACEMLSTDFFKANPTLDIKGVLLGGALKNVIAIAGGIIEGLGYNHNTRAALITRGIVEMLRFGKVFQASPATFYGPSGMGDLILTTTGELSRNKGFGIEIAKGRRPEEIISKQKSVVEGYKTTKAAHLLALKHHIRARIFSGLYEILYEEHDPKEFIETMMRLPPKFDEEG